MEKALQMLSFMACKDFFGYMEQTYFDGRNSDLNIFKVNEIIKTIIITLTHNLRLFSI